MLLKMEKHVNACVMVILIGLTLCSGPYICKEKQEQACTRNKLW
jgi:hypothetical protein